MRLNLSEMRARFVMLFLLLIAVMFSFGFGGCTRPKEVSAASKARTDSIKTYVANDEVEDAFLIEKYKESEKKRVNMAYKLKMEELKAATHQDLRRQAAKSPDGKLTMSPQQAFWAMQDVEDKKEAILLKRDMMLGQVDIAVSALYAARKRNKLNLAVATKLNDVIEEYENAGVDMTAAQKGIDSIFKVLEKYQIEIPQGPPSPPPPSP